jgi:hypothetical protein
MPKDRTMRRSQAIQPYGPGAILDWGQECFVVMDTKRGQGWRRAPKVTLQRLQDALGASEGFRLPPVKAGFDDKVPAIEVQRFPSWLFCPSCRAMVRWHGDKEAELHRSGDLPRCENARCRESILVPMRYVAACEDGHVADVDWWRWAHSRTEGRAGACDRTDPRLLFLSDAALGSSLEALSIKCARCGAKRDLHDIAASHALAGIGQRCPGRQPWQARDKASECTRPLKALLRSQTAVHFSKVVSALDVHGAGSAGASKFEIAMEEVLENNSLLAGAGSVDEVQPMLSLITRLVREKLQEEVVADDVLGWFAARFGAQPPGGEGGIDGPRTDEAGILDDEWPALTTPTPGNATKGALLVRSSAWRTHEAVGSELRRIVQDVFLVERLRLVRALVGFSRLTPEGMLVRPDLGVPPLQKWLPATEVFGEGIFVKLDNDAVVVWERDNHDAIQRRLVRLCANFSNSDLAKHRFAGIGDILERFVAVHTLSHLMMRQLCYEAGYGAASIAERLYVSDDRAGFLIYTADGDSEGSLGGLVRQGESERLAGTFLSAMERAAWCSNDPICMEMPETGLDGLNRSACHACSLVPETSCSHVNSLLDRMLVVGEGLDGRPFGLFRGLVA